LPQDQANQEASSLGDFIAGFELSPLPTRPPVAKGPVFKWQKMALLLPSLPPVAQPGRHLHLHLTTEAAQEESVSEEAVAAPIHRIQLKRDSAAAVVAAAIAVALLTPKESQEESLSWW